MVNGPMVTTSGLVRRNIIHQPSLPIACGADHFKASDLLRALGTAADRRYSGSSRDRELQSSLRFSVHVGYAASVSSARLTAFGSVIVSRVNLPLRCGEPTPCQPN